MQNRNAEHNDNQKDEFLTRDEFHHSSTKLGDSMMWLNRGGGGSLMWAFDGQSPACYGRGSNSQWTESNIDLSNYAATSNGGPYVTLNGTDEILDITDAPWQESTTNNFLVWAWLRPDVLTAQSAMGKWDANAGNFRSWRLYITTASVFGFQCNDTGAGGAGLALASTKALTAEDWYFVGGYIEPSSLQVIAVGSATDTSLTYTSTSTSVPATLFDGTAALYVGGILAAAGLSYWDGRIGVGLARGNVPSTGMQSHMTRLFAATRWFYQE